MAKIIGSPNRYVQSAGLMAELGQNAAKYGSKALVIIGPHGLDRFGDLLTSSFENSECTAEFVPFNGECSQREIDRIGGIAAEKDCDVI